MKVENVSLEGISDIYLNQLPIIMLHIIILSVIMPNVIMLSFILINGVMPKTVMLSVTIQYVVAPFFTVSIQTKISQ
jgi:hypothetical protein